MHRFTIYSPLGVWKKGEYPTSPFLHLAAGAYSEQHGHVLLSAQLMTDSEIDEVVDGLKKELEEFRTKAKKELKSIQDKMLNK